MTRSEADLVGAARRAVRPSATTRQPNRPADPTRLPGYAFVRELHRGGQGVVYEAVQHSTGRAVAIKLLRHGAISTRAEQARLEREVQILGRLRHPAIVTIHDSGTYDGLAYFVMDYIDGEPLDVYAAEADLPPREWARLFQAIAEAVHAAQLRGVIHRDLKPANILIDGDARPHLLDFGLAKVDGEHGATLTQTGQFIGSLPWSAPEQARGQHDRVDVRTDVYALGVIAWQVLTGRFPYELSSDLQATLHAITRAEPRITGRRMPKDLETIFRKCLAKDPDRRYRSAGELADELAAFVAGRAIAARRDSALYVLRTTMRRHWLASAALLTAFGVAVASAVGFALMFRHSERARAAAEADRRAAEDTLSSLRRGMFATVPGLPALRDDYSDGEPDPRFVREGDVREQAGRLVMRGASAVVQLDPAQYFLRGDFDISVDFACDMPDLEGGAIQAGLYAVDPHSDWPELLIARHREHNPQCDGWPEDRIQGLLPPAADCDAAVVPYAGMSGRLRMVRRGTRGTVYWWSDGWRELTSGPVTDRVLSLRLFLGGFFTDREHEAAFDNLTVETVFPTAPLCLDELDDDFSGSQVDPRYVLTGVGYPREEGGRLVLRKQNGRAGWVGCTLDPARFRLCGDFSLSVACTLLDFPAAADGDHFAGVQVLAADTLERLAALEYVRTFAQGQPHDRLRATRGGGQTAFEWNAESASALLRIERRGSELLAAPGAEAPAVAVGSVGHGPVVFRLYSGAGAADRSHLVAFDDLHVTGY